MTPRRRITPTAEPGPGILLGSALFFASGFTGLAYEVLWLKRFAHVWGSSTLATAAVVGSFLLGLGLGAQFLGRFADRTRRPLWWYGVFEIVIGLLALAIPLEIGLVSSVSGHLYNALSGSPLAHYFARLGLTFVVIGPPTIMMGGTLPLIVRQFATARVGLRASAGWFYGVNTVGAAAGCYITGFHVLGRLGLSGTNWLAATGSIAIGVVALVVARGNSVPAYESEAASAPAASAKEAPAPRAYTSLAGRSRACLYLVAALTGATALLLQIVWVRQLSLVLGGTTYAFTAVLFVVLVGIGLGSVLFRRFGGEGGNVERLPVLAIPALIIATVLGQLGLESLTLHVADLGPKRVSESYNAYICVLASSALELVPALVMGVLFPYLVNLMRLGPDQAGAAVGRVYAANTVGTLLGATLTGAIIVPAIGSAGAIEVALVGYAVALFLLWPLGTPRARVLAPATAVALALLTLVAVSPADPRVTNGGGYLYGSDAVRAIRDGDKLLMYEEGPMTSVLVTEFQEKVYLRVDGKVDATSDSDMHTQLGLAYFPRFLRPEAREVLVIGYGSGATAGASCLFPDTRVVCCEIEPAVYDASRFFTEINHDPPARDNFEIVLDDGRSYLQATDRTFDLIISEPSNPWMPGIANLFTREYYETAQAKLNPGGMVAQWVQAYDFDLSEYALIARTLKSVFPHVALIRLFGIDTILMASEEPLDFGTAVMDAAQALVAGNAAIEQDLLTAFGTADVRSIYVEYCYLDSAGVERLIARDGGDRFNTDGNMRLAFDAPRRLFRNPELVGPGGAVDGNILAATEVEWFTELFAITGSGAEQAGRLAQVAEEFRRYDQRDDSQRVLEFGLSLAPKDQDLLVQHMIRVLVSDAEADAETWRQFAILDFDNATRVGVTLWESGSYLSAVAVFQRLSRSRPSSGGNWANLAVNLQAVGRWPEADAAWARAVQCEPGNAQFAQLRSQFQAEYQRRGGR